MALCIWEHDDLYVGIPWKSNLIDHPQNHHVFWHVLAPMKKSGFRAAVAGRMTIPHMSSILWCGKAQKKNYPQLATMDGILFTILQMEFTLPNYDGW